MSRHFWDIVLILDRLLGFGATHVWKAIRSLLYTLPGSTPTHKWTKGRIVWGHSCCTSSAAFHLEESFCVRWKFNFQTFIRFEGNCEFLWLHTSLELFDLEVLYGPSSQQSGLWSSLALPITLSYSLKRGRWLGSTITLAHRDLHSSKTNWICNFYVKWFLMIMFCEKSLTYSFCWNGKAKITLWFLCPSLPSDTDFFLKFMRKSNRQTVLLLIQLWG